MELGIVGEERKRDVLSDYSSQQAFESLEMCIDVDHARLQNLLTAECQELPCERSAPLDRLLDLCRQRIQFALRSQFFHQHAAIA